MPNACRRTAAHASTTSVAPTPIMSARMAKSAAASIRATPSEEHAHAGADATARQRRHVLPERRIHPPFLVHQFAALYSAFPSFSSCGFFFPLSVPLSPLFSFLFL